MSQISKQLGELMAKEMTRQEFLKTLGLFAVSIFGFSALLPLLTGQTRSNNSQYSAGYSAGPYGN